MASITNLSNFFSESSSGKEGEYELKLKLYENDICALWRYEIHLQNCIKNNFRIRPSVLKKFLELLQKPLLDDQESRESLLKKIKESCLDRMRGTEYDFRIESSGRKSISLGDLFLRGATNNFSPVYSLEDFLTIFFVKLKNIENFQSVITTKREFIATAYENLHNYLLNVGEQLSFYQYCVIIGYLTSGFGLLLNEQEFEKSPTKHVYYTAFLNNSTKYVCGKTKQLLENRQNKT